VSSATRPTDTDRLVRSEPFRVMDRLNPESECRTVDTGMDERSPESAKVRTENRDRGETEETAFSRQIMHETQSGA
jgi:hypothetical protein